MSIVDNIKNLIFRSKVVRVEQPPKIEVQPTSKIFTAIGGSQNYAIEAWRSNQDIVGALQFSATMQLRTPLRVLLRHDEIHTDINKPPPEIALEMWEGIWNTKTKTYRELGIDFPDPLPSTQASSIGPIFACEYLPFLLAIRKIVELNESIESRIIKLSEMLSTCDWREFVEKHGGIDGIVLAFFPKFMNLAAGLDTPNRISAASDETLLGIKGVGRVKLKAIRERCASIVENRDNDRLDRVLR